MPSYLGRRLIRLFIEICSVRYLTFRVTVGFSPKVVRVSDLTTNLLPENHIQTRLLSCAGYDDVDHPWLASNGCYLSNTPNAVTEATADMGILLMLAAVRGLYQSEVNVREGRWRQGIELTDDPTGMTVGFLGLGESVESIGCKDTRPDRGDQARLERVWRGRRSLGI